MDFDCALSGVLQDGVSSRSMDGTWRALCTLTPRHPYKLSEVVAIDRALVATLEGSSAGDSPFLTGAGIGGQLHEHRRQSLARRAVGGVDDDTTAGIDDRIGGLALARPNEYRRP